jgi:hypothetical protein
MIKNCPVLDLVLGMVLGLIFMLVLSFFYLCTLSITKKSGHPPRASSKFPEPQVLKFENKELEPNPRTSLRTFFI